MEDPLKKPLRVAAWCIVITCWLLYGFINLLAILHPSKPKDPTDMVTDFKHSLQVMHRDWGFTIFVVCTFVLYFVCWSYLRKDKHED